MSMEGGFDGRFVLSCPVISTHFLNDSGMEGDRVGLVSAMEIQSIGLDIDVNQWQLIDGTPSG